MILSKKRGPTFQLKIKHVFTTNLEYTIVLDIDQHTSHKDGNCYDD